MSGLPSWKSAFFALCLPSSPFSGGQEQHLEIQKTEEKNLFAQRSSDLLKPPSLKPPFVNVKSAMVTIADNPKISSTFWSVGKHLGSNGICERSERELPHFLGFRSKGLRFAQQEDLSKNADRESKVCTRFQVTPSHQRNFYLLQFPWLGICPINGARDTILAEIITKSFLDTKRVDPCLLSDVM